MNRGDTFTLVSACFSALFIIFVGKIAHFQKSIASTNCIYLFFTTLFFGCTLIFSKIAVFEIIKKSDAITTCGMLYLGLVTYLGQYLQTYGQQNIEPSKAALIFANILKYLFWLVTNKNFKFFKIIGKPVCKMLRCS